jgi:anti-anti-sigma factor
MDFARSVRGEVVVLAFRGSIRPEDNDLFAEALSRVVSEGHRRVVLDARDLEYANSRAIGQLVAFTREIRVLNGRVALVRPCERLTKLLMAVGLMSLVPSCGSLDGAVEAAAQ